MPPDDRGINPYAPPIAELGRPAGEINSAELAEAEADRRRIINHESWIKCVGVVNYVVAVQFGIGGFMMLVFGLAPWTADEGTAKGPAALVVAAVLLSVAAISYGIGRGLRGLRPWGRRLTLSWIVLAFLINFVQIFADGSERLGKRFGGTVFSSLVLAFLFWLLRSEKGQIAFSEAYNAAISRTPHIKSGGSSIVKFGGGLLIYFLLSGVEAALMVGIVIAIFK